MSSESTLKPLTESVLRRLTSEAVNAFLGESENFLASAAPGLYLGLCNEPVADLNMLVVGAGSSPQKFHDMARSVLDRQIPFVVMIFPEAGDALDDMAADLGLVYAVDFPFMVRQDAPIQPAGHPSVEVTKASGDQDAAASASVLASAFQMPVDSALRAIPSSVFDSPSTDVYLARVEGEPVGTVMVTRHGDTGGIWAMGTDSNRQRGGVGKRLLSSAIAQSREAGLKRFFLGATPAGFKLYEGLGFQTEFSARIWVSGETHQA